MVQTMAGFRGVKPVTVRDGMMDAAMFACSGCCPEMPLRGLCCGLLAQGLAQFSELVQQTLDVDDRDVNDNLGEVR